MLGLQRRRTRDEDRWAQQRLGRVLPARLPVGLEPDSDPLEPEVDPVEPVAPPAGSRLRSALISRVPAAVFGGRLALDRRAVAGLVLVGSLAVVLGLGYLRRSLPVGTPLPPASAPSAVVTAASATASPSTDVVVDVAGKVRRTGIVRVPAGSRVVDALAAAGGALPGVDLTALNLARRLVDGEQLLVGVPAPAGGSTSAAGPGGPTGADPGVPLDLNAATVDQLQELPGVGPVLAQRIVDWRVAHGRFSSVDELREVSGIGAKKFADLRTRVRV